MRVRGVTIKGINVRTIKFHKTECGVDFLLNVLVSGQMKQYKRDNSVYNTDFFEVLFFKKARGTMILNQQKIGITDNCIVFVSPFQKQQWLSLPENPDYTFLVFQEDFLNEFFADKLFSYRLLYFYQLEYPLCIRVTEAEMRKACDILMEIKSELVETKPDSVHIIRSLLYYLLQKLNREYAAKNGLSLEKPENNYAYQFKKLLEVYIREKQRINDYTEMLGISRISLNKAVKTQFNVTATHLLKQRLLFEIKNYLIHSELTVAQIADELHFPEPNHLMRFFKAQTGLTTTEFLADHPGYQNGIIS